MQIIATILFLFSSSIGLYKLIVWIKDYNSNQKEFEEVLLNKQKELENFKSTSKRERVVLSYDAENYLKELERRFKVKDLKVKKLNDEIKNEPNYLHEPIAIEQLNGFYIYNYWIDKTTPPLQRLLDKDLKHILSKGFKRIDFNKELNVFFCFGMNETIVYDVTKNEAITLPYVAEHIFVYDFNFAFAVIKDDKKTNMLALLNQDYRIIYDLNDNRGILVLNYFCFFYHNYKSGNIINREGVIVLSDIKYALYNTYSKKYLVQKQDEIFQILNSDFELIKELEYYTIRPCLYLTNEFWLNGLPTRHTTISFKYFLACKKIQDQLPEKFNYREYYCLLDENGNELFKPCYTKIEQFEKINNEIFKVWVGDIKRLDSISENCFDGVWEKEIKIGVINSRNEIIIPIEYTSISQFKSGFILVRKEEQYKLYSYEDDYNDEISWDYELEGGKYGVFNSLGKKIINEEYDSISYEIYANNLEAFRATKNELSEPIYFDMNGNKINVV